MHLTLETERELDGRWIAEVPELPGCIAYGETEGAARSAVAALALRTIADRVEHAEAAPDGLAVSFGAAA